MRTTSDRGRGAAVLLVMLLLAGCGSVFGSDEHLVLDVAEGVVPCTGVGAQECLLVRARSEQDYHLFYGGITGFTPEPGYRYRLRVSRRAIANPPADGSSEEYRLVRVDSKVRSPRYAELVLLHEQLAKWRAHRPVPYDVVVERLCFCAPEWRGPVRVQVAVPVPSGLETVLDQHYVDGGQRVDAAVGSFFPGVEGLFGVIVQAIARDVHQLNITYDPALGHPTSVFVDPVQMVADDEVEYRVLAVMVR